MIDKPLEGLTVLDFSQFLSGPSAALRLADLGARVIKIERPDGGDLCRRLYISNLQLDGDSTLFHSINRNKESAAFNLKEPGHMTQVYELIRRADVMIQNFRPGVIGKLGLHYEAVKRLNPRIVYGTVTGYGEQGPWAGKPGQDLLVQSLSGLTWLNGNAPGREPYPTPFGLAVTDMMAGAHLVQGILACLARRGITNEGGLVEVSLLESTLDLQAVRLSDDVNYDISGRRSGGSPEVVSGIYATKDGYIALADVSATKLGQLLVCPDQADCAGKQEETVGRGEVNIHAGFLARPTSEWLEALQMAGIACTDVFTWTGLAAHDGFKTLDMIQQITRAGGTTMLTTRCPIRIDGELLLSGRGAPRIGEHTDSIRKELERSLA